MSDNDEPKAPGTASEAKVKRTGCGFRYDEEELKEGIDFSAAKELMRHLEKDEEASGQAGESVDQEDNTET